MTPTAFGAARRSVTALSTPPLIATATRSGVRRCPEDTCERVCDGVGGKRLAGDGRGLEQRQTGERPRHTGSVGVHDTVAVDDEARKRPLGAARGVTDHLCPGHRLRLAVRAMSRPVLRRSRERKCSTLPMMPRAMLNLASQVGALPSVGVA